MMTHTRMLELVDMIFADLEPDQAGEFAELMKYKIMQSYSTDQLKIIDDQLLGVGVDVNPICRKKVPT